MRVHDRENQINRYLNLSDNDINFSTSMLIAKEALELYTSGEVDKITIVYTKFINAITFEVTNLDLLPFDKEEAILLAQEGLALDNDNIIFTPSKEEIIRKVLPSYIATVLYGSMIESKISENASRRNAMDAATKNAKQLAENYKLVYNTLRQGKITSEITEIVAGSDEK